MHRCLIILFAFLAAAGQAAGEEQRISYQDDVRPILQQHCFACHNQDDPTADLALDSFETALAGGAGGAVLAPGDPDGSRLWKLVTKQEQPSMPPDDELPDDQLQVLRRWIAGGLLNTRDSEPIKGKQAQVAAPVEVNTGKPRGEPAMPEQLLLEPVLTSTRVGPVAALATSRWAPVAALGWQRQVLFYHTQTHKLLGVVPYFEGTARVVRFSRDGSVLLVAGGRDAVSGSATLYDVKTGAALVTVGAELDTVLAADVSADLALIALGGPKKKVRVYRVADGKLAYELGKHTDWITALEFSPDGELLATADRAGGVRLWQAAAGHERADLRGHQQAITALSWRFDAASLATASEDGSVRLWNREGKSIKSINAHSGGTLSVRFGQSGEFVSTGRDRHVKRWKSDGAALADLGKLSDIGLAVAFTHDCKQVLASDFRGEVRVLDVEQKSQLATLAANPPLLATRIARSQEELAQVSSQLKSFEEQLAQATAQLESGETAHSAHAEKLAAAQQNHAAALDAQQQAAAARVPLQTRVDELHATVAAAEAASMATQEENEQEQAEEDRLALEQATEALANAEQALKQAEAQYEQTTTRSSELEAAVAQIEGESSGLPDLDALRTQQQELQHQLDTGREQLDLASQHHAWLLAEQQRVATRGEQLTAEVARKQQLREEASQRATEASQSMRTATNELATLRDERTELAEQIEHLQQQLTRLEQREATVAATVDGQQSAAEKAQQELSEAARRAQLAEALQRDFDAAEALRSNQAEAR